MPAFEVVDEQDLQSEEIVPSEERSEGSERFLKAQRKQFEAEVEHANSVIVCSETDGPENLYSKETLDRAVSFLQKHIEWVWKTCGSRAPIPMIGPGPHESVDLYWKQPSWKLLVNIPADKDASATFYGDDYGRQRTKGSLDPNELSNTILAWLM